MRTLLLSLCAGLVVAGCSKSTPPVAAKTDTSAIANIQVVKSPGGVTAWLVQENFVPIVAMEMSWRGGAPAEAAGKEGTGWLLGYMMNEGAGDLDSQAFGARMEELNMSFGCSVEQDWTGCSLTTLKDTANDSFEMMRQALNQPRLDAEPIARAKRELAVSLLEEETDPGAIAEHAMTDFLMPGHPYARRPQPKAVANLSRNDILALKAAVMTKDRLLVTVVGDISAAELAPKLDEIFGALPATSNAAEPVDVTATPAPAEPILKPLPIPQTLVTFSGPGVKRSAPDFYAAYLLNYILGGGGFSSRLMDDIREDKGLTYGIGTGLATQRHLWRWTGSAATKNATALEVVKLTKEHIDRLGKDGPTDKELADAKAYLTGAYPLNFDSNSKIARNLMQVRQDDLGLDYVAKRNSLINGVTLADVKRVAAKYMKSQDFTFVMVGQPDSASIH